MPMTSTPQSERQEQEIAEIATELRRAGIKYRYGEIVHDPIPVEYLAHWLHDAGLRLVGGEAPEERRAGDGEAGKSAPIEQRAVASPAAPQHGGSPMTLREIMEDESPAAPAVDEILELLMYDLRRAQDGEAVSHAAQAIRDYVDQQRVRQPTTEGESP